MTILSHTEIESIASTVAAILQDRMAGDPFQVETWIEAARGLCSYHVGFDDDLDFAFVGFKDGRHCHDDAPRLVVGLFGNSRRPLQLARNMLHELSHVVLTWYAPECFTETPWRQVENPYQAHENICRAVERHFLGDFGRGWLPAHGYYWN